MDEPENKSNKENLIEFLEQWGDEVVKSELDVKPNFETFRSHHGDLFPLLVSTGTDWTLTIHGFHKPTMRSYGFGASDEDEDDECTCKDDCPNDCKDECGCKACRMAWADFLAEDMG